MANSSTGRLMIEHCWTLVGRRQGRFWYERRMRPTKGDPASVAFDAAWATEREEAKGDLVGFYHTHPSGMPSPSARDDRTMWAWVSSLGKPLLCVIEADGVAHAHLYVDDASKAEKLTACELLPRGVVLVYDERSPAPSGRGRSRSKREVNDGQ